MSYNFSRIEDKWQKIWQKEKTYKSSVNNKPKYYILDMFPYPSGSGLHVGHPLGYIASDIIARFKRNKGFNVLHPMGFDSFGLPAEQYAIKTGEHPKKITNKNIIRFKEQLGSLGLSFDWDREIKTSDSNYYKWTQWIFLKLYNSFFDEKNQIAKPIDKLKVPKNLSEKEKAKYIDNHRLTYIDEIDVNWCEELGTVLSNEEVIGGLSERGGFPVIKKPMKQWVMRITAYSNRLLEDLDNLDWPDSIKLSQKNWIGKSEGAEIFFKVKNNKKINVFTTRPDTIYGATYLVLAPEHDIIKKITSKKQLNTVNKYINESEKKSDLERQENEKNKTGIFTGAFAINPISNNKIPIWISDYVLSSYGTGAIMAVPAHDERDFEFASKFNLPIIKVISSDKNEKCYTGNGKMVNSGEFNGISNHEFKNKVLTLLEKNKSGKKTINYKLRDWIFTRQRYWGEPIPILHSKNGRIGLKEKDLPLTLPNVINYLPTNDGLSPLARNNKWSNVNIDGIKYKRESNTMPQWAGSCWYYLRFIDPLNNEKPWDSEKEKYWMPVDLYVGGVEHAVLHLLYSRFYQKIFRDLGLSSVDEPFKNLLTQGMVLKDGAKMSKNKGNTVDPQGMIDRYGADTVRLFMMFAAPPEQALEWSDDGLQGASRFLNRFWTVVQLHLEKGDPPELIVDALALTEKTLRRKTHQTISKVSDDIGRRYTFNTAIAALMEMTNFMSPMFEKKEISRIVWRNLNCRAGGCSPMVSAAWPNFSAASNSPIALITLARRSSSASACLAMARCIS